MQCFNKGNITKPQNVTGNSTAASGSVEMAGFEPALSNYTIHEGLHLTARLDFIGQYIGWYFSDYPSGSPLCQRMPFRHLSMRQHLPDWLRFAPCELPICIFEYKCKTISKISELYTNFFSNLLKIRTKLFKRRA